MKVVKPTWVNHEGLPIFAIDVHPEGTRFATGGQGSNTGGRISIWNIVPVLEEDKSEDENVPKLLCELEFHACVNAVRWSHDGTYLSCGGDDRTVEIYKCSSKYKGSTVAPSGINNPFAKASYEQWRSVATLTGHSGDILDVAWSPTNKYLASASIDNSVIIWDAMNFPHMISQLKGHTSMVKGVTWDPIGKFVASQSDDRTLRIWRTCDWQLEHIVKEPFMECGGTTHVLRLDWSPDGMYLVSAHAMNAGGPTAQIVERTGWKTDKDFVGHRKAVVCVRFNRSILQKEGNKSKTSFVALGSRDRAVSVWSAALKRPVVVVRDLFKNSIMDLSWSSCGTILTCCSYDGTVAVAKFSVSEIGKPITTNEVASLHQQTYGNNIMMASHGYNLVQDVSVLKGQMKRVEKKKKKEEEKKDKGKVEKAEINSKDSEPPPIVTANGTESTTAPAISLSTHVSPANTPPKLKPAVDISASRSELSSSPVKVPLFKQIETVRNDGKRRITPQFLLPQQDSSGNKLEENSLSLSTSQSTTPTKNAFNTDQPEILAAEMNGQEEKMLLKDMKVEEEEKGKEVVSVPTCSVPNDKAALLEARVSEASAVNFNGEKVQQQELPALISKPRMSTGSGSGSDLSKGGPNSEKVAKSTPASVTGAADSIPGSAILKRKRSQEEGETKPSKKGKPSSGTVTPASSTPSAKSLPPQLVKATKDKPIGYSSNIPPSLSSVHNEGATPGVPFGAEGQATTATGTTTAATKTPRTKLPAMKLERNTLQVCVKKTGGYNLVVENHKRVGRYISHNVTCIHEKESLNGLTWTVCVESPICGMTGDAFRIVVLCEDSTCHILDMKGRYSMPPVVVPNYPHSMIIREQYLMVVTVKATLHLWNVHLKKNVIRCESLLPLLNQPNPEMGGRSIELSRCTILVGGVPLVILSNGKSYKFSPEMQIWMLFVNFLPSLATVDTRDPFADKLSPGNLATWNSTNVQQETNYAAVSEAKLKLAGAIESKKSADVKVCMHALGIVLAREGLELELRHLLLDLLGPCHSAAVFQSQNSNHNPSGSCGNLGWNPLVAGVPKREVLRTILKDILVDLRWQDLYCEFNELLEFAESSFGGMELA